jgi:hypothetical protein
VGTKRGKKQTVDVKARKREREKWSKEKLAN